MHECFVEAMFSLLLMASLLTMPRECQFQGDEILTIAGVLSSESHIATFTNIVGNLTAPTGYKYRSYAISPKPNPVATANEICDTVIPEKVCMHCHN